MTQIQFYQLLSSPLERALPRLLERAYGAGHRVQVRVDSNERLEQLNQWLWTYDPDGFLPHGGPNDAWPERQVIFLTTEAIAPNAPDVLLVTEGSVPAEPEIYKRVLDMFEGRNEAALAAARGRWKQYKDAGHAVSYYQQKPDGGWEQKA